MLTANGASGTTHDFFCYDDTGQVWNGSAFVAWVDANYATYRVTATERGTSGTFTGAVPDGTRSYEMRVRSGTLAGSYVVWAVNFDDIKTGMRMGLDGVWTDEDDNTFTLAVTDP